MADNNNQAAFSSSGQTSSSHTRNSLSSSQLSDGSHPLPGQNTSTASMLNTPAESQSQGSTWTDETQNQNEEEDEYESEYEDESQREETEYQDDEQTPSLSSSASHTSDNISEPETPPDSQSIPLPLPSTVPLPSTERSNSSRSSTPVSSSSSETGSPQEPFRRSRAPSPPSYVPTREGTPQREEGPQESLEGIEESEDREELGEDEQNEGDESWGRWTIIENRQELWSTVFLFGQILFLGEARVLMCRERRILRNRRGEGYIALFGLYNKGSLRRNRHWNLNRPAESKNHCLRCFGEWWEERLKIIEIRLKLWFFGHYMFLGW